MTSTGMDLMAHNSLRFATSLLAISLALLIAGCSTKAKGDRQIPLSEQRAVDLLQTEDVLWAMRLDVEGLPQAAPLLEKLPGSSENPLFLDLIKAGEDPLQFLSDSLGLPSELEALNRDEPAYLLLTHRGNEQALIASRLGLLMSPEELPRFLNLRVLLPSQTPERLFAELKSGAAEDLLLFEGSDFVRIEAALALDNSAEPNRGATKSWLKELELQRLQPPSSAEKRPTPAFNAFVDQDAQIGLWLPMKSLASLTVLEIGEVFRREYEQVGPAGKPRFHIEGVGRIAASAIAADPVSAENEDMALLFTGQGKDVLVVDYVTSRTARGQAIAKAHQSAIELPLIHAQDPFLELSWRGGLENPEALQAAPRWSFISDTGPQASFEALTQGQTTGVLPADKKASLPELAAFLQYPSTYITKNLATIGSGDTLPLAATVKAFALSDPDSPLPLGAALAAVFPQSPELRAQLEQWLAIGQMFLPATFDAALLERDGLLEVRAVLGAELGAVFPAGGPTILADSTAFSLDLARLQQRLPVGPDQKLGELLGKMHLSTNGDDPRYGSARIVLGADSPQAPLHLEPQVEPLQNPTERCETDIAALAVEKLRDLRTDAQGQVEEWAQAVESLATECVDPGRPSAKLIEERIEQTRQRAQEIP